MSVLQGSLEAFALPDVFRLLSQNKITGALRIQRESGDGVIYFREGEVYFAFSSITREFLGQRLVTAKLITQGQLLRILDEQKKTANKRLGDLLVEKGILSKDLLDTFIKEQIQDAIFDLLQWDMGIFTFDAGEESNQEVGLSVSVENLIMESSRRLEEWEVIQRKIPSVEVVVRMSPTPPEDVMEINIKPDEWTLLVLADGRRTVGDIAAATERSEFEAARIIYGLVTAGLLDVASGATPVPSEAPPRATRPPAEVISAEVREVPAGSRVPEMAAQEVSPELEPAAPRNRRATDAKAPKPEPVSTTKSAEKTVQEGEEQGAEANISKETLLRLIAGVRNL